MTEVSISAKLQQLADELEREHDSLLELLEAEDSGEADLLHDFPIFSRLDRNDSLIVLGLVALSLSDRSEAVDISQLHLADDITEAINCLSEEQIQQILLPYLASQLQQMPIPCGCCGQIDSPREPESGFCERCDRLLNSPAALQVCGTWDDGHDPEHINGISSY